MPGDEPDASRAAEEDATVEIVGFAYSPAELTISAGSEVTFTNLDSFSRNGDGRNGRRADARPL